MPVSKTGKLYVTDDQIGVAAACSALDYAQEHGYDLVHAGRGRYYLREHDSMIFLDDGRWYWNSRQLEGRAISFIQHYEGRTFPEAVSILCACPPAALPAAAGGQTTPAEPEPFTLPQRASSARQLFAYLCGTRKLDRHIVTAAVRSGSIYQSQVLVGEKKIYNAVFVGFDGLGRPRSAFQRGITSFSRFKGEVGGSDKNYPFVLPGAAGAACLGVFEAAIDAISHATAAKRDGGDPSKMTRIATGGNFPLTAITNFLDAHPHITELAIGTDNDDAGRRLRDHIIQGVSAYQHITIRDMSPPAGTDWNNYLTGK